MSKEDRKPPKNHYIKIMKGYNIHFHIIILLDRTEAI